MPQTTGKFMVAVGAIIQDPATDKILLLKRTTDDNYFSGGVREYPTGRMNQFEEPIDALHREIKEETGLETKVGKLLEIYHIFRGEKTAENELVGIIFHCYAKSTDVILSEEHTDFQRTSPQDTLEIITHEGMKKTIKKFIKTREKND